MTTDPTDQTSGTEVPGRGTVDAPSEAELRASYEAELSRITSTDMMLQATVSLLNIAAHRLGPPPGADATAAGTPPPGRDMEQVRDAIDGVRALLEILERRIPAEVRPLRDGLSRLQMAYAAELRGAGAPAGDAAAAPGDASPSAPPDQNATGQSPAGGGGGADGGEPKDGPGPAQASGRLWVPGR